MRIFNHVIILLIIFVVSCTGGNYKDIHSQGRLPYIDPDYSGVTVPPNIAPLNFVIKETGTSYKVNVSSNNNDASFSIKSSDAIVRFPKKLWRNLLENSKGDTIGIQVSLIDDNNKCIVKFDPIFVRRTLYNVIFMIICIVHLHIKFIKAN